MIYLHLLSINANCSKLTSLILPLAVSGHVIPPDKVHEKLFVGSERAFAKPSYPAVARYNRQRTEEQITKMTDKLLRKEAKLRKRLAAQGIDYDFPGFVSVLRLG